MKIHHKPTKVLALVSVAVLLLGTAAWAAPFEATPANLSIPATTSAQTAELAWPATGQAAVGIKGVGILGKRGQQTPVPTASVAKVFTAIAVLQKKPIQPGQPGPLITMTQADVNSYQDYYNKGGSFVPVTLGEQLTQRQALEALMLPSANNMADTLARWAFGSMENYLAYINGFNQTHGLTNTHIADASGFSPQTVSTSEDLVKIGTIAMSDPVLSSIVSEEQATLPVAGTVRNTNWLLGINNINGIKTGNTDEAGGCFLFSTVRQIGGRQYNVIGAVMAAPGLEEALTYSRRMAASLDSQFIQKNVLQAGQNVGFYQFPWGKKVPILAGKDTSITYWFDKPMSLNYSAKPQKGVKKKQIVGSYSLDSGIDSVDTQLLAGEASGSIPWRWRLYQRYL